MNFMNFKQKCQASESMLIYLLTWLGLLLHELLHQCGVAWRHQPMALANCNESAGCSLIFLLTIPHRFSMGFRSGKFAGLSSTVTPWSLNQLLVCLAVWAGAKSC